MRVVRLCISAPMAFWAVAVVVVVVVVVRGTKLSFGAAFSGGGVQWVQLGSSVAFGSGCVAPLCL